MYYLIKGKSKDDTFDSFEWVVKAETKEDALAEARKDLDENEEVTETRELTIDECIAREYKSIEYEIERQYLINHYDYLNTSVRVSCKITKEFESSRENFYEAIKEANKSLRLLRRLDRVTNLDDITVKDLRLALCDLARADTEEQFDVILQNIIEKYGRKIK